VSIAALAAVAPVIRPAQWGGLAAQDGAVEAADEVVDRFSVGNGPRRHNFRRTYHGALAKLANPATAGLRPTAARVLGTLCNHGPLTAEQLAVRLKTQGRTVRVATIDRALAELAAAGATAVDARTRRWTLLPGARHPLLEAVDLHGAHDCRHTFSTWLEDAGIPARVIDELMGHQASGRSGRHQASAIGAHYRHTTPEMAARVVAAVEERLVVVLVTAIGQHSIGEILTLWSFRSPMGQRSSPAMRLTEPPTMTTPNRYDTKAWTSTVCRILGSATVVSDTW
jgi:hypothetical protein